jgi:hypothetical protein
MNKIWKMLTAAIFCAALMIPGFSRADAALKLAVVPLIIGENVEDDAGIKPIAYSSVVGELFQYPDYDMVEAEPVRKAALAQQDHLFSKDGLTAVARATGADVVIAMSVDTFDVTEDQMRREPVTMLNFRGKFATINMLNGKYVEDHYRFRDEMESGAIHPKYDYPHQRFRYLCKRELNKAVKNNKIK